jgi:hypothetical protein
MTERLQEYCDSRGVRMRIDREEGVIRGVKILGLESRNRRSYLPEALAQAARLYEDAKVNVNHPKGNPGAPRDYQDRMGVIRNVEARPGEGLFADFYFNPKHALAEQLIWDAEHAPENVGFSHNVEARTVRQGERIVVEAITRVQSVDLVADPATTRSLFESAAEPKRDSPIFVDTKIGTVPMSIEKERTLTAECLKQNFPELVEEICREALEEQQRLQAEVQRLTALDELHQKRETVRRLLREFNFPDAESNKPKDKTLVSQQFLELLLAAENEEAIRELVEERAHLVRTLEGAEAEHNLPDSGGNGRNLAGRSAMGKNIGHGALFETSGKPCSRDQNIVLSPAEMDVRSFVEAIT